MGKDWLILKKNGGGVWVDVLYYTSRYKVWRYNLSQSSKWSNIERPDNAGGTIIGGVTKTFQWLRAPSIDDINKASGTDYEFSRGDGIVYIYNRSGVQSNNSSKTIYNS